MVVEKLEDIIQIVRDAGVIGAGGAGFPTYVKLQVKVEIVLANGSECEPLLHTDKALLKENAAKVLEGMKIVMQVTGAQEGIIAIKGYYKDVVAAVEKELSAYPNIRLHKLENYYPAGDEFLTVYDATGRVIPEGGLPLSVGVVNSNPLTYAQIKDALDGKPVTHRMITVAGEVARPIVIEAPLGMSYRELLEKAGGVTCDEYAVIDGGPMMGKLVADLDNGIGKTSSGLLVLPEDHFIVRMRKKSIGEMVRLSKAACCQCFRCTDLCPRNLLGHELYPHMTMRTIDYNMVEPSQHITSAFLCSQCGMCELIACDFMQLSPRKVFAEYRKLLASKGIKNPHQRKGFDVRESYEDRKVSIPMVLKKLGLEKYKLPYPELMAKVLKLSKVRLPIRSHIGAPAQVLVTLGQKVMIGELVAQTEKNSLGASYHASIAGSVTDITDSYIEILGDLK